MASGVILIGLGGLSLDLLDPLIQNGWLPNLEYLLGHGVVGPLSSSLPPFPASEWATLLTGEAPGATGFVEGWRKSPGSYFPEVASLRALAHRSPHSLLARTAPEMTLVGIPLPPVPELLPPEETIQVLRWQADRFSARGLPISKAGCGCVPGPNGEESPECFLERATRRTIALSVSISRIVQDFGSGVMAIHFSEIDRVLSRCYRDTLSALLGKADQGLNNLLRQFFRVLDDAIWRVVEFTRKSGNFVILASAHGFGPLGRVLNLNSFLVNRGDLGIRPEAGSEVLLREIAAPVLRSMKIGRGWVKRILRHPALQKIVDRTGPLLSSEIGLFDWTRTRAFAMTRTGITLNVRGCENQGTLNPGPEERALGEEIQQELLAVVDPATGKRPIREIRWREEMFEGPGLPELPHLLVQGWDPDYILEDWRKISTSGAVFSDPLHRTGSPRSPGFYCFSGTGIPDLFHSPRSLTLPEIAEAMVLAIDRGSP